MSEPTNLHRPARAIAVRLLATGVCAVLGSIAVAAAAPAATATATATGKKAPASIVAAIPSPLTFPTKDQLANTFVGALQGNPSALSIVIKGSEVLVYWCDGVAPGDWFGGTINGSTITAASAKGITVTAKLAGSQITGQLTKAGKTFSFTLKRPSAGTGVFRHTGDPLKNGAVLGWIVLDDAVIGATNEADGAISDAVPFSLNKKKFGGGCLRQRLAIRLLTSAHNPGVIDAEIEAGIAGCDTTGVGPNG